MDKVKRLLEAGASLSHAVKAALGDRSLSRVALERGVAASELSASLSGNRLASERVVSAMIAEFGGTVEAWRELFASAMQTRAAAVVNQ